METRYAGISVVRGCIKQLFKHFIELMSFPSAYAVCLCLPLFLSTRNKIALRALRYLEKVVASRGKIPRLTRSDSFYLDVSRMFS